MQEPVSRLEREAAEDVFFGQIVINWARWFVIAAGTILVMVSADTTFELGIGLAPVIGLMVVNFYLHGRRLVDKPANGTLVGISSVIYLSIITAIVMIGPVSWVSGLESHLYVLYFPVVAAFAFVSPRRMAIGFTVLAGVVYATACMLAGAGEATSPLVDQPTLEVLITRVIVLLAVGGLGTYFWKVQRDRRHSPDAVAQE